MFADGAELSTYQASVNVVSEERSVGDPAVQSAFIPLTQVF
jgi:hypothetical protein